MGRPKEQDGRAVLHGLRTERTKNPKVAVGVRSTSGALRTWGWRLASLRPGSVQSRSAHWWGGKSTQVGLLATPA